MLQVGGYWNTVGGILIVVFGVLLVVSIGFAMVYLWVYREQTSQALFIADPSARPVRATSFLRAQMHIQQGHFHSCRADVRLCAVCFLVFLPMLKIKFLTNNNNFN
jgi:hypothetical protein